MKYSTLSKAAKTMAVIQWLVIAVTLLSGVLDPSFIVYGIIFSTPLSVIALIYFAFKRMFRYMVLSLFWIAAGWAFLFVGFASSHFMGSRVGF